MRNGPRMYRGTRDGQTLGPKGTRAALCNLSGEMGYPMQVKEYMTSEPITLSESDTLHDAFMLFMRRGFRHLPVTNEKKLVGIVTERDINKFSPSILSGMNPEEYNRILESTPVSRVMLKTPMTIPSNSPVRDAAELLFKKRIGCLPVVDNDKLVGIITTVDLLGLLTKLLSNNSH